ncbi:MAG: NAD(P)-dependent oxidoreductase [Pseudomonadota bacterium]
MVLREHTKRLFVVGANSAVGQLLRAVWRDSQATWCARAGAVDAHWDLRAGPHALAARIDGASHVLCLAGATPGAQRFDINTALAQACVKAAEIAGCARVFLASSMAVYGAGATAFEEDAPLAPLGAYGASKAAMEEACLNHAAPGITALRLGNVVGADQLFRNIQAGAPITLDCFADGTTPRRSYIDPTRLAQVLCQLMDHETLPPVLNVAAAPAAAMGDLADAAGIAWARRPAPPTALPVAEMALTRLFQRTGPLEADAQALVDGWRAAISK